MVCIHYKHCHMYLKAWASRKNIQACPCNMEEGRFPSDADSTDKTEENKNP